MAQKQSPFNKEVKIPSLCQMCDESSNTKWMCIECDLFFCAECESKFHKKSKTLAGHNKIDIEQCGTENIAKEIHKAGLKSMNCEVHSDLVCVLFCQNCQQPVCTKCLHVLENKHKEHRLSSISDVYDEKFCEMEDFRNRVGQNIPFCSKIQNELEHMLDSGTKQYGEQRQILIQKGDDVITEFQSNIKVLLKEVDSEWKTLEGTLKEEIKVMKILKDHMEKEREIACQVSSASDMLTKLYPSSEKMLLPKKLIYEMILKQVSYKPSKTSHDDMKEYSKIFFGKLKVKIVN
ncbi:unnamed protein product [Mytilus coruscus]|uniref:B box-type domain-containing protein n=1 Tax=Mytilus coruscus TaxID=42192 RepID=A0A6J7ZYB6_MYTCO|nr:unnamed protein product [Mytilus coruscus]